jgi:hypothetical protein
MTILAKNIKNINRIEQNDISNVSFWLFDAVKISNNDTEKSIKHKIELLKFLLDYLPQAIDIDALASDKEQLEFIKLLSKLTDVKEDLELLIGEITLEELEAIGENFSKKTQNPVGDLEAF